jgi:hypothetical protein
VTLAGAEEAGRQLGQLAALSGLKPKSRVHGLGDGAPWIAEQMEVQFGTQGSYLIDFYHLCAYLATAAPTCSKTPKVWLEEQKARFASLDTNCASLHPTYGLPTLRLLKLPVAVSSLLTPLIGVTGMLILGETPGWLATGGELTVCLPAGGYF